MGQVLIQFCKKASSLVKFQWWFQSETCDLNILEPNLDLNLPNPITYQH
jgi:hypothetical protein